MRIAWFHPDTLDTAGATADPTASVIAELATHLDIDRYPLPRAHDFVWRHARRPYDVTVYELQNTTAHEYVWPYLVHEPGVLHLRSLSLHDSRAAALRRQHRQADYAAEFRFDRAAASGQDVPVPDIRAAATWPMLRAPLAASRLCVVEDAYVARQLALDYRAVHVRTVPTAAPDPFAGDADALSAAVSAVAAIPAHAPLLVGLLEPSGRGLMERALARARQSGTHVELLPGNGPDLLRRAHLLAALRWPTSGEPLATAVAAMAAARPVVVFETEATAGWPALNPQSWQPRDRVGTPPPIVVSIDPLDDEHSLVLTMRRLAADHGLRRDLGRAAREWWQAHATLEAAADAWRALLEEAARLPPPPRPAGWPPHLSADGTARARELLADFATSVDVLEA